MGEGSEERNEPHPVENLATRQENHWFPPTHNLPFGSSHIIWTFIAGDLAMKASQESRLSERTRRVLNRKVG